MDWHRLDPSLYAGPVVLARVARPGGRRGDRTGAPFVQCWALIDTGATHSAIDARAVANPLALRSLDRRTMVLAQTGPVQVDVHEVTVSFPDFGLPDRLVRVSAMHLPGPFFLLVGMDLLDGTRLELDVRGGERWIRWTPVS